MEFSIIWCFENSIVNMLGVIAAYCLLPKKQCFNVQRIIDTQLTLFKFVKLALFSYNKKKPEGMVNADTRRYSLGHTIQVLSMICIFPNRSIWNTLPRIPNMPLAVEQIIAFMAE